MSVVDFPSRKNPETEALSKVPPQNVEAEQAVLGAILIDNPSLNKALEILNPDDFYRDAHRRIFSAILDLNERNEVVDLITLTDHLRNKNELEAVGGAAYLSSLVNSIPTAANIRQHSRIIHEKAILRNLITVATDIVGQGYEDNGRVDDLLDFAERSVFGIAEKKLKPSFVLVKEIIKEIGRAHV